MLRTRSPRKEKISNCYLHSNSLSNKMDNSLLAVRDINHKYIVVAKEVAEMLDVSVSHAYKVIREANRELSSKGFYVRAGRVSRKYLDSKVYDLCDKTA